MNATPAALMHSADHNGRKLLAGRVTTSIPAGSWLVLIRHGDDYRLTVACEDPGDPSATITLASFLSPEQIDDLQQRAALEAATATRRRRKTPRKRKASRKRKAKA